MLRAVLVGLLSVTAVGCKSGGDPPASQPGLAAGKVIEVSGTVTVRHGDVARPLAKGETVEGDDVVETGADGNVVIELGHSLARWELGANKKQKVRESLAWGLAKKSGDGAQVEQSSAAAGREAERTAADTAVSAAAESAPAAPAEAAPSAAPAPAAAPAPKAAPARPSRAATAAPPDERETDAVRGDDRGVRREKAEAPPPPDPDPKTKSLEAGGGGGGAKGGGVAAIGAGASVSQANIAARDQVLKHQRAIQACLTKDMPAVTLAIRVAADGKASVETTAKIEVPPAIVTCVTSAVAKIQFAPAVATVMLDVRK